MHDLFPNYLHSSGILLIFASKTRIVWKLHDLPHDRYCFATSKTIFWIGLACVILLAFSEILSRILERLPCKVLTTTSKLSSLD